MLDGQVDGVEGGREGEGGQGREWVLNEPTVVMLC